jgi:hypothetical protein
VYAVYFFPGNARMRTVRFDYSSETTLGDLLAKRLRAANLTEDADSIPSTGFLELISFARHDYDN